MTTNQSLTNEQKLEEVYQIITAQEGRRKGMVWLRVAKWLIILGVVYLVVSQPEVLVSKIMDIVQPIVMEQAQEMMKGLTPEGASSSLSEEQKEAILRQFQSESAR